jgi:hypothetical protein
LNSPNEKSSSDFFEFDPKISSGVAMCSRRESLFPKNMKEKNRVDFVCLNYVQKNSMRPNRLHALTSLSAAMLEVNAAIEEMREQHDPLASHIFIARRQYQCLSDTKSGKRHQVSARLSWQQARDLGFRGNLEEWQRLLGATPRRE